MFSLKPLSPALSLALRISLSILGILVGVLCIFVAIAYDRSEKSIEQALIGRLNQIENRPQIIDTILQEFTEERALEKSQRDESRWKWERESKNNPVRGRERIPPFARNTIVLSPTRQMASGFLGNSWIDLSLFGEVPIGTIQLLNLADEGTIYIVGRSIGQYTLYSYEPADLTRSIGSKFLLWGILSLSLFALAIFGLSLRIARQTLAPIEAAKERAKSYNRYLAHELKTPLSIVANELELTRSSATYDANLNASSLEEIKSMSEIINGLLILSEAERSIARTPVPLHTLVQNIVIEIQKIELYHNRTFEINIRDTSIVIAEPVLLQTLIKNLLLNALKHGAPESVIVNSSKSEFVVSNTLLPNTLIDTAHIFEEFTGTPGAGNGLGLSLCKRIADIHGWGMQLDQNSLNILKVKVLFRKH